MAGVQLHGVQANADVARASDAVVEAPKDADDVAEHVAHLRGSLDHRRPGVRLAAARTFAEAGTHAAPHAAVMAQRLNASDGEVLRKAEANLINMGEAGAQALSDALRASKDDTVRTNAIMALGRMGTVGASMLVKHLADKEASVRQGAGKLLAQLGEIGAHCLGQGLQDSNPVIRVNAARSLGWMAASGDEAATASYIYIPNLVRLLDDTRCDGDVRRSACEALMAMECEGGEALASRLGDDSSEVHRAAASSLLRMGDVGIVVLTSCMSDPSPAIRRHALTLLTALGPHGAVALAACLEDLNDAGVRRRAAEGLGQMDADLIIPHVDALAARLEDTDHWVRVAAARSIGKLGLSLGGGDFLQPYSVDLAKQMMCERKLVRHSAAQALGRAGAEVARPHAHDLASGLGDKDLITRTKVANCLSQMGEVGPDAAGKWLRSKGEEPRARSRAALCRSGLLKGELFDQAYATLDQSF